MLDPFLVRPDYAHRSVFRSPWSPPRPNSVAHFYPPPSFGVIFSRGDVPLPDLPSTPDLQPRVINRRVEMGVGGGDLTGTCNYRRLVRRSFGPPHHVGLVCCMSVFFFRLLLFARIDRIVYLLDYSCRHRDHEPGILRIYRTVKPHAQV